MPQTRLVDAISSEETELVFGLVAPTGIDLDAVQGLARDLLGRYDYRTDVIRLSDLARRAAVTPIDDSTPFTKIRSLQNAGNELRRKAGRGDVLALHAVHAISTSRESVEIDGMIHRQPRPKRAYLLRSLKHPEEVESLRRVYGAGFLLIGVYASEDDRFKYLNERLGMNEEDATFLLRRDEDEKKEEFGQHTRDTFRLADVFVTEGNREELGRFFDLVFNAPFVTPTIDEYSMFLAFGSSMRSAQFGRQVGAVIVSKHDEVIGVGANDVPKFGGGLYWPGPPDTDLRDHNYGDRSDSNERAIESIIRDAIDRLEPHLQQPVDHATLRNVLLGSRLNDLTEFGRAVHAEMEALLACARTGVSVRGATLYTTTFPCHNCARHIIAAGVSEVVYVEPYPKSRASELHDDSIALDDVRPARKVLFKPFIGVAARRFFDLFSMKLSAGIEKTRKDGAAAAGWEQSTAKPRVRMSPFSYLQREREAVAQLRGTIPGTEATQNINNGP